MKCPHCGLIVTDRVPRCVGCGFSMTDLDRKLGAPPQRRGFVNDYADLLEPAAREALEVRLAEISTALQGEIVLVTRAHTRPVKPSEWVFWLFNRWNIGGEAHAGILLLL
ncbi:MAG: TPM domain-containing protein, partial [Armatimonadota bacterium]|nr:TPM domain-containing protein [Armatimonadota bacterium]